MVVFRCCSAERCCVASMKPTGSTRFLTGSECSGRITGAQKSVWRRQYMNPWRLLRLVLRSESWITQLKCRIELNSFCT